MSHVVTAPLVISKKEDGSDLYLYEGSELPEFVEDDEVKRLVALGLVVEAADSADTAAKDDEVKRLVALGLVVEAADSADTADGQPRGRRKPAAESN